MPRFKDAWSGEVCGQPRRVGRGAGARIEIPVQLDNEPDREVFIGLPLSKVDRLIGQLQRQIANGEMTSDRLKAFEEVSRDNLRRPASHRRR